MIINLEQEMQEIKDEIRIMRQQINCVLQQVALITGEAEEEIEKVKTDQAIYLLQERNYPVSDRYRYNYKEISSLTGYSPSKISSIAREKGLSRRREQ